MFVREVKTASGNRTVEVHIVASGVDGIMFAQIVDLIGCLPEDELQVSAKEGTGVPELLERIVEFVPAPSGNPTGPLRALIFDSYYDRYRGAIPSIRVVDGSVRPGMHIAMGSHEGVYDVAEVGYLQLGHQPGDVLTAGEVLAGLALRGAFGDEFGRGLALVIGEVGELAGQGAVAQETGEGVEQALAIRTRHALRCHNPLPERKDAVGRASGGAAIAPPERERQGWAVG